MCNWNTRRKIRNGADNIFEVVMVKNFPKLMTDAKPQIQEVERIPSRINILKNYTQRYHIQMEGNQGQIENLELKNGKKILIDKNGNNYSGLLIRNHISKK